jgi:hypothetical protein
MLKIIALSYISESEIKKVQPDFSGSKGDASLESKLFDLGLDVVKGYEEQQCQHRNRFNEVVECKRWVGNERTDKSWVTSGYASIEAIDKAGGNRLITDLYHQKGMVESE